jgi:S1-C subfamily serine protease
MLVPIDLLEPILEPMLKTGRANGAARPWLGMYTTDAGAKLVVAAVAPGSPADRAGVKIGDLVLEIAGEKPTGLADLWRKLWRVGPPGCEVPLKLLRKQRVLEPRLESADRGDFLKKPHLH